MKVRIDKHKLTDEKTLYYNKPEMVYIPLISGNDTDISVLVNKGEYVYKGTMIAKRKGDFRIPIHASVSGTVVDFVERTCFNGTKVRSVVIKNDYKEALETKKAVKKSINKYTKDEFVNILRDAGIIGLGGAGFPTYVKYENTKAKTLLVNAIECEPYITTDEVLAKKKVEEILETIDAIVEINNMDSAIIVIKDSNEELKNLFDDYVGTYLKLKVKTVKNYYPAGWERNLIKDVTGKEYGKLPIEAGVIVNNISTIYAIYQALKYGRPLIERIVTFSGEGIKQPCNVLVKIGTQVKDILKQLGYEEGTIISGGPMMGVQVDDDLVMSANQNSILVLKDTKFKTTPCLKCGKCIEVCPVKLSPVLIMKAVNASKIDKEKLRELHPEKCIECGLCSYVCPAKIQIREAIIKAKKEVK